MQTAPEFCFQFREAGEEPDAPNECNSLGSMYMQHAACTRESQHGLSDRRHVALDLKVQCVKYLTARFVFWQDGS